MYVTVQVLSYVLWFPLILLTINSVFRAGVRRYSLIFFYLVVTFLIAVMQLPAMLAYRADRRQSDWLNTAHAAGEGLVCGLLVAVVVSMIYRASTRIAPRRVLRTVLFAGAFAFMAGSALVHYDSRAGLVAWLMLWTRDQNVCAAVLDFALWTLLLASRERDRRLLLLTGGMGIMFAGDAMAGGIRHLAGLRHSNGIFLVGNVVAVFADCAFLYVWWQTFRRAEPVAVPATARD